MAVFQRSFAPLAVNSPDTSQQWLARTAPALFVLVWATGFVVAKFGLPYAAPLSFLSLRFILTLAVLLPLILLAQADWPSRRDGWLLVVSGILVHAGYLGGVWCAIKIGMPAGVSALIVNLQPIVTAAFGPWLGERVKPRQWFGLALGLAGVTMVIAHRLEFEGMSWATVALSVMSLLSITFGTVFQKKYVVSFDLRTGTFIQYVAALAVIGPLALAIESEPFQWGAELVFALAWSVLALSIGAIFLMYGLYRRGAATRVASLFYLVPPCTVAMVWLLFGEAPGWFAMIGMGITAVGVALVQRR